MASMAGRVPKTAAQPAFMDRANVLMRADDELAADGHRFGARSRTRSWTRSCPRISSPTLLGCRRST